MRLKVIPDIKRLNYDILKSQTCKKNVEVIR